MKKFGTPIGAAPGSAKEKVGFDGVGVPFFARGDDLLELVVVLVDVEPFVPLPLPFWLPLPPLPLPLPVVVEDDDVELEEVDVLEVVVEEDEDDEDDEEELELELGLVVVGVVEVVEVGGGGGEEQDSETEATGSVTGSGIDETGVPGGTLTVKDCWAPPTSVTVMTHVSADAVGISAIALTPSTALAVNSPTVSFRFLNTLT